MSNPLRLVELAQDDRRCTKCGGSGPFYNNAPRSSWCRACTVAKSKADYERRKADPTKVPDGFTKVCPQCGGEPQPATAFYRNLGSSDGLSSECRKCRLARHKARNLVPEVRERAIERGLEWQERHQDHIRQWRAWELHKVDFNAMWSVQGGLCALCREPMLPRGNVADSAVVDHDHRCCATRGSCGKCVRGLIHSRCNHLLGKARDRIDLLKAAIAYLEKTQ
jgi:hypothetical protein